MKQIETSFERYVIYQRNLLLVVKMFFYLRSTQLNLSYTFDHRVIGLAEQHTRGGTNITFWAKMKLIY